MSIELYKIESQIKTLERKIIECIDPETGEISDESKFDEISKLKDSLSLEKDDQSLSIAKLIKNHRALAEAISDEKKELQLREESIKSKIMALENVLMRSINEGEELEDSQAKISWRKSSYLHIEDDSMISGAYFRVKKEIDKVLIKKDLKNGITVENAEIRTRYNLGVK